MAIALKAKPRTPLTERAAYLYRERLAQLTLRINRGFALLMLAQWAAGVAVGMFLAPSVWPGASLLMLVWEAIFVGAGILLIPTLLALVHPNHRATGYSVAIGQILFSTLLVHLARGQHEIHFTLLLFLTFLTLYRDWRILAVASVTAILCGLVGSLYPQMIYGTPHVTPGLWLEYAIWVVLTDALLIMVCTQSVLEMHESAARQAQRETEQAERADVIAQAEREGKQAARALDVSPDAVILLDAAGTIVGWNTQAEAIFGWTAAEVLKQPVADRILAEGERESFQKTLRMAMETGSAPTLSTWVSVYAQRQMAPQSFPAEIYIAPMRPGLSSVFAIFGRDVTEQRQEEQEQKQQEEQAAAQAQHERRTASQRISHAERQIEELTAARDQAMEALQAGDRLVTDAMREIHKPMNDLLSLSGRMLEINLSNTQRAYAQDIHEQAQRLLTTVTNITQSFQLGKPLSSETSDNQDDSADEANNTYEELLMMSPLLMSSLRSALQEGDTSRMETVALTLEDRCRAVGANELAEIFAETAKYSRAQNLTVAGGAFNRAEEQLAMLRLETQAHLRSARQKSIKWAA